MSSGMFNISFSTSPASLTRSSSRSSLAANATIDKKRTTTKHTTSFFMSPSAKKDFKEKPDDCATMLAPAFRNRNADDGNRDRASHLDCMFCAMTKRVLLL